MQREAARTAGRTGAGGLETLYRVWQVNMRDLGSPAHRRRWFEGMFSRFGARAACYLVRKDGEAIGGLVALDFRDTVVVPWASSDRRHFKLCPNNLLYWTAIREAAARGLARFDFGRSSVGSGTYQFKRQWGAAEIPLYWQDVDPTVPVSSLPLLGPAEEPPLSPAEPEPGFRARAERARQRLPVPVAAWLGGRLRGGITL
jgi:CelD/BcsL family acetyltransferase involved in cellulose biosynthesis